MKNVPGRRTDWHECQWLQFLHSVGLLRAAFRPEGDICAVRCLMRHRAELVEMTSQHILHMHKALTQMNVQIQHVISDITGITGLAIVDSIILLERLVAKKLEKAANAVRKEGWKWVEVRSEFDPEKWSACKRWYPERAPLPAEQQQELDALVDEAETLAELDELDDEGQKRLESIQERIDELDSRESV